MFLCVMARELFIKKTPNVKRDRLRNFRAKILSNFPKMRRLAFHTFMEAVLSTVG